MLSKCLNNFQLNLLDGGIMISMNFFAKNVRQALSKLRMQYLNLSTGANISSIDYFNQLDFTEVDKM